MPLPRDDTPVFLAPQRLPSALKELKKGISQIIEMCPGTPPILPIGEPLCGRPVAQFYVGESLDITLKINFGAFTRVDEDSPAFLNPENLEVTTVYFTSKGKPAEFREEIGLEGGEAAVSLYDPRRNLKLYIEPRKGGVFRITMWLE